MATPVSSIRNLGAATDAVYASAGITSAEQLRDLGPDASYETLLTSGARPHFIAYYAMVMGLQGRPWNDCQGDEKRALRARFDAIKDRVAKNGQTPDSAIEAILNQIGTGTRR
ncbi:MAG: TfoX/Sxy family DNA transformation protein [Roseovarius sp.]|nr:TfoX/Sxy family DNA transformation protein [Roseovarius sp.]